MAFLSQLLGNPVTDLDGAQVGVLQDLVATTRPEISHPVVVAIVIRRNKQEMVVPYSDITVLFAHGIPLNVRRDDIHVYTPGDKDIFLVQDVLDKQIIDTDDVRVVRVNDIELVQVNGSIVASNVDISAMGILRRIGLGGIAQGFLKLVNKDIKTSFISWDDVELFSREQFMRLRVPGGKLADLHPADIANILSDMNRSQSNELLESLNLEQLADTLEEVEEDFQVSLVENMPNEKVADVLEEMSPDEAADLLAELPKERSQILIGMMEGEEAEDVRKLLAYPEDSAGGIMTTDFTTVGPDLTAGQTIQYLRENATEMEPIFYVYVIDSEEKLLGVFSLSELIFAQPDALVSDFMHKRVASVQLLDDQDHVAQMIARYNLLSIPVIDEQNVIQGIVTSDDALDKIIPTVWKKRLPRYYR
ncbi:Mg/Co/Ni transporter MgtE [Longilinea arvoryzae]|uniref:Mg/Co/Ni transporter MgtE n=1 Tax=Longilinea arvoryzae TaxID=360412 RepID=A0A0S7BA72_9CHLR|nr:CBS domain-containing protein [Longilinea arvoryzae]GAP14492.1 Mg/Co/Ni transporter MgtE [Longilinea arvoryzae]